MDEVFSVERMWEFVDLWSDYGIGPSLTAFLSVYVEFFGAILLFLGAFVRPTAFVLILNFAAHFLISEVGFGFIYAFDALFYVV